MINRDNQFPILVKIEPSPRKVCTPCKADTFSSLCNDCLQVLILGEVLWLELSVINHNVAGENHPVYFGLESQTVFRD